METENHDVLIGHVDETDGILEFDNRIPGWLRWGFYGCIAFGFYLIIDWHVITPRSLEQQFESDVAAAVERWGEQAPTAVAVGDAAAIAAGRTQFAASCVACHAADGTGNAAVGGPNLTDAEWKNGTGSADDINNIIYYGIEGKPMPAWGPQLGSNTVASLAAYVYSLSHP